MTIERSGRWSVATYSMVSPVVRTLYLRWRRMLFATLAIGAVGFIAYANQAAEKDEEAEKQYLKMHPLTKKQLAANAHFEACWQYRNASSFILPEKQRNMLLRAEKCYLDERQDPHYEYATYPWNRDAPQPWKNVHADRIPQVSDSVSGMEAGRRWCAGPLARSPRQAHARTLALELEDDL